MMDRKMVNFIKEQYPPGTRIRLNSMEDPYFDIFTQKAYYMLQQKCSIIFCWSNARFWTKEISHNGNGDLFAGVVSF